MTLTTARLRLEPWDERGRELAVRLAALPEITRYLRDGIPYEADEAAELSARQAAHWREHGWGSYVGIERSSGTAVAFLSQNRAGDGTPGLDPCEHEIGWWVDPAAWGRGYATEGARALVAAAFEDVGSPSVVARIHPDNAASLAVARAVGLRFAFASTGKGGQPIHVLRLDAPVTIAR